MVVAALGVGLALVFGALWLTVGVGVARQTRRDDGNAHVVIGIWIAVTVIVLIAVLAG